MSFSKPRSFSSLLQLFCVVLAVVHSCAGSPTHGNRHSASHLSTRQSLVSGVKLRNKSNKPQTFYFYPNVNGVGTWENPTMPTLVNPGDTVPVQLDVTFKGRVQRGNQAPATWVEFQVSDQSGLDPHQGSHGDISLIQGYDGPATIAGTDNPNEGQNVWNGFTTDIMKGAPAAAIQKKPDGTPALASTEGLYGFNANPAAMAFENGVKLPGGKPLNAAAYVAHDSAVADVASNNKILLITFY